MIRGSTSSRMETFQKDANDPFTAATEPKVHGYTYTQALEMHNKCPEVYHDILNLLEDSAFD